MPHSTNFRIDSQGVEDRPAMTPGAPTHASNSIEQHESGGSQMPASHPDGSPASDGELVRAACAQDRSALASLYQRYARTVHGVLLSRVSAHDADDLVHDVFLKAMHQLPALRDRQSFGPWICAIARNLARDHLRSNAGRRTHELPEMADDRVSDTEARERANEILAVMQCLPEAYREPLVLRLVEQMSGSEIAECTGKTHRSVRVNLHRGMKLLRERLSLEDTSS